MYRSTENVSHRNCQKNCDYASVIIPSDPISFMYKLCPAGDEGWDVCNINSHRYHLHTWCLQLPVDTPHWAEDWSSDKDFSSLRLGFNTHKTLQGREDQRGAVGKQRWLKIQLVWMCSLAGVGRWRWDGWQNDDGGRTEPKAVSSTSSSFLKVGRVDWLTVGSLQGTRGMNLLYFSHVLSQTEFYVIFLKKNEQNSKQISNITRKCYFHWT